MPSADEMLGMSDEDFLKMNSAPVVEEEQEQNVEQEPAPAEATQQEESTEEPEQEEQASVVVPEQAEQKTQTEVELEPGKENQVENVKKEEETPPNYEQMYNQLMAPLKANGKTIELRSPEELIQLAQMGANYTKKMQAIQPHRKILMMLDNNGLLDEGKLSYLIDLDKKNPQAIQKLVKDSGIDPLQIDTEAEPTYREGNHRVGDEEAAFVSVLEDLKSTPEGVQTLQTINTQWDQASKEVLWKNPELMDTIHAQRANGIYDMIASEVERLRMLGTIPSNVSFINAYKAVGDDLNAKGVFSQLAQRAQASAKAPVAVRAQQPKPTVVNSDKASAAALSRNSPKKVEPFVNPLALSDDEFLKNFKNRL